jgi:SAM-dependent methyltransferase
MLACPVCSDSTSSPLARVAEMPLIGCQFAASPGEARAAARGTLELSLCGTCGHVYNRAFEPERIAYVPGYDNALGFSARHRAELDATVDRLIDRYALRGKSVVEIGCGSADFLSRLCAGGGNRGVGYDPSQPGRTVQAGEGSMTIRPDTFDPAGQAPVDFVCSQHVLEHLAEVAPVLRGARTILERDGHGYFEVPNGLSIFRDSSVWDLTYEHVSYFSPGSLHRALEDAGFSILRMESSFGGQYLYAEVSATGPSAAATTGAPGARTPDHRGFPAAFARLTSDWRGRISGMVEEGRRVVLWGAGTKAVSFLNMLGIGPDDGIEHVVDINPRKAGRYLPGTAQEIISPERLADRRPDVVVVMNPEYVAEIRSMIESMGLGCELVTLSPAPR